MTTLVTGGAGFIGGLVVRRLRARGERARVLDLAPPEEAHDGFVQGSILDPDALRAAVAGVEAVIHAAALAQLWAPRAADFERVNAEGARRVIEAAGGARVVLVSSYVTLVAATAPRDAVLDERAEHPPEALLGPYPRAKRAAELAAVEAARRGRDVVVALPTAPIGAGGRAPTPPMALLRDLAAGALPALVDAPINLTPAEAVAEGLILARDRGRAGRRYLLAGEDTSLAALAAEVARRTGVAAPRLRAPWALALAAARTEEAWARLSGRPPRASLTGVRLAVRRPRFDGARARAELGFAPGPLGPAIEEALAWLRATGRLKRPPG